MKGAQQELMIVANMGDNLIGVLTKHLLSPSVKRDLLVFLLHITNYAKFGISSF